MKNTHLYAVIMAGGSGERFWPVSRTRVPKQLLPIVSQKTMIQETVARVVPLVGKDRVLVVTNCEQAPEIKRQLKAVPAKNIIPEPVGRDTAPCIAYAATVLEKRDPDAVMIVMPADHVIRDENKFRAILKDAAAVASRESCLIAIGITPSAPHTGYGYIRFGEPFNTGTATAFRKVQKFEEKPNIDRAKQFLADGNYYWNSGMFIWKASTILAEIKEHMPVLHRAALSMASALGRKDGPARIRGIFQGLERRSIDYGVMEKSRRVIAAAGDFYWDDVGSWASFEKYRKRESEGNVIEGECVTADVQGSLIISRDGLIAALGVTNIIIVKTKDAVLVCPKERLEEVKHLVKKLKADAALKKYT
jgi:mannose-1-phosphate guanylyltransferase